MCGSAYALRPNDALLGIVARNLCHAVTAWADTRRRLLAPGSQSFVSVYQPLVLPWTQTYKEALFWSVCDLRRATSTCKRLPYTWAILPVVWLELRQGSRPLFASAAIMPLGKAPCASEGQHMFSSGLRRQWREFRSDTSQNRDGVEVPTLTALAR